MNWLVLNVSFQFDDDFVRDQQIRRVIADYDTFELNLELRLKLDLNTPELQFNLHGTLIDLFQEPKTKNIVNFKCRADELLRDGLQGKIFRRIQNLRFICAHLWLNHGLVRIWRK